MVLYSASVCDTTTSAMVRRRRRTTSWHRLLTTRRNLGRGHSAVETRSPNLLSIFVASFSVSPLLRLLFAFIAVLCPSVCLSVCPSVRPSVRHVREFCQNEQIHCGSKKKNAPTLADYNYDQVQSILIIFSKLFVNDHKSCLVVKFSTSPHICCHYTL